MQNLPTQFPGHDPYRGRRERATWRSSTSASAIGSNRRTGRTAARAWSLVGNERVGSELGRFTQVPDPGHEADWPFESDFERVTSELAPGEYYPRTLTV